MKMFYIASLDIMHEHSDLFKESHAHMLKNGSYIMGVFFWDSGAQVRWEQIEGVTSLPHPLSGQAVGNGVADALGDFEVLPTDTTYDVAEKLSRHHPLLRVTSF